MTLVSPFLSFLLRRCCCYLFSFFFAGSLFISYPSPSSSSSSTSSSSFTAISFCKLPLRYIYTSSWVHGIGVAGLLWAVLYSLVIPGLGCCSPFSWEVCRLDFISLHKPNFNKGLSFYTHYETLKSVKVRGSLKIFNQLLNFLWILAYTIELLAFFRISIEDYRRFYLILKKQISFNLINWKIIFITYNSLTKTPKYVLCLKW